jgi:ABC-type amino acid transport substrate-binding protein
MRRCLRALARWWAAWLLAALLLVGALRSIDLASLPFLPDPTWSRVQRQGVLRVGTDASYPPLADMTPEGAFVGLDVDLARAIASKLGVQVEFANVHWDGLFGALDAGRVDMIISAVPYDGTLTRNVSYSSPYADLGLVLVTREGVDFDLTLAGERVGVELGSEAHLYVKRRAGQVSGIEVQIAATAEDLESLMTSGKVDVAICDRITGGRLASLPDLKLVLPPLVSEPVHVVTERSASRLTAAVNQALVDLERGGQLAGMVEQWLGRAQ